MKVNISRRGVLLGAGGFILAQATVLRATSALAAGEGPARVTILYDALGSDPALKIGWGYSALLEYGGRRILFDTGGDLADFSENIKSMRVDLGTLDFVVLTHRHGDHTSGLHQVLKVNPDVKIYAPVEQSQFDTPTVPAQLKMIQRRVDSAPQDMHYYNGKYPERIASGSPWPGAKFTQIRQPTEVLPGFWLFSIASEVNGTKEMNEISMAVKTPQGLVLMVGCSHPGIEKILDAATKIDPRIYSVFGGFHLVSTPDAEVTEMAGRFKDKWRLERIAAGHCTGEFAFSEFNRLFGARFDHAVVGAVIPLPT
jgi:7,8-dihydropterin-6-yl-methyl-4-(beta-D-ribofuranosyl)aminobenzene 5'-phosphate synthase